MRKDGDENCTEENEEGNEDSEDGAEDKSSSLEIGENQSFKC